MHVNSFVSRPNLICQHTVFASNRSRIAPSDQFSAAYYRLNPVAASITCLYDPLSST